MTVPEEALFKDKAHVEYGSILVPVFGTEYDDDIVSTAGRLADAADEPGELEPSDRRALRHRGAADDPARRAADAGAARGGRVGAGAGREVGAEYDTVQVGTSMVRARNIGSGIVAGGAAGGGSTWS